MNADHNRISSYYQEKFLANIDLDEFTVGDKPGLEDCVKVQLKIALKSKKRRVSMAHPIGYTHYSTLVKKKIYTVSPVKKAFTASDDESGREASHTYTSRLVSPVSNYSAQSKNNVSGGSSSGDILKITPPVQIPVMANSNVPTTLLNIESPRAELLANTSNDNANHMDKGDGYMLSDSANHSSTGNSKNANDAHILLPKMQRLPQQQQNYPVNFSNNLQTLQHSSSQVQHISNQPSLLPYNFQPIKPETESLYHYKPQIPQMIQSQQEMDLRQQHTMQPQQFYQRHHAQALHPSLNQKVSFIQQQPASMLSQAQAQSQPQLQLQPQSQSQTQFQSPPQSQAQPLSQQSSYSISQQSSHPLSQLSSHSQFQYQATPGVNSMTMAAVHSNGVAADSYYNSMQSNPISAYVKEDSKHYQNHLHEPHLQVVQQNDSNIKVPHDLGLNHALDFTPVKRAENVKIFTRLGHEVLFDFISSLDGKFFINERYLKTNDGNDALPIACYRRNFNSLLMSLYFSDLPSYIQMDGIFYDITDIKISVTGTSNFSDAPVELSYFHTNSSERQMSSVINMNDSEISLGTFQGRKNIKMKRFQFKKATPNNGKYIAKDYYYILLNLSFDLVQNTNDFNGKRKHGFTQNILTLKTNGISVRGRNPSFYTERNDVSIIRDTSSCFKLFNSELRMND